MGVTKTGCVRIFCFVVQSGQNIKILSNHHGSQAVGFLPTHKKSDGKPIFLLVRRAGFEPA
jgi:hypothetical protein